MPRTASARIRHNAFAGAWLLLALLLALPARAEVLARGPGGFLLENRISVAVPPERAWQALVDEVGQWWPADHSWFGASENFRIRAVAGGCFCEIDGARQVEHMRISHVDPPQRLRMLGGLGPLQGMGLHGALDWVIRAQEGGSEITLRDQVGGYTPEPLGEFVDVVDRVQAQQLGALGEHLRAAPPR